MKYKHLLFEELEPGIGLLRLNRPEKLNALNLEMVDELYDLFRVLKAGTTVRILIITGEGKGFCAGADLDFKKPAGFGIPMKELLTDTTRYLESRQKRVSGLVVEMYRLPQPIIAAVNGAAAGGGLGLALAADIIYAGPQARFTASFVNLGLTGGEVGTSYFLPSRIGRPRTAEFLMTGRTIDAEEADKIGLVCRAVEEDQLMDVAMNTARQMIAKSETGLRLTKAVLNVNTHAASLEAAVDLEDRNQSLLVFGPDFKQKVEEFSNI
ncbi:enoyl-CoA hydratase/isomerase family protein [bacterium]|nr:enoyl-CoA hydratase/isomerase family protein [bacterium]